MQVLLNLLTDNRQLTVLQYDRVIRYLQDKRELQLQLELGDAKDLPPVKSVTGMVIVTMNHDLQNLCFCMLTLPRACFLPFYSFHSIWL